jgi:hypothetical protein
VIAISKAFARFRHYSAQAEFTVQREITSVLTIAEPQRLFVVIPFRALVPENVEGMEEWLCTAEQQITKLRLAI